jgi:uncharacterized protein YbaR (Trm112 family)
MFIELIDVLRCPNAHEETWLVLATHRMDGRDVLDGVLGCPVCEAEFRIAGGIAHFDRGRPRPTRAMPPDESEALRLAALFELAEPRGYVILVGGAASQAPALRALTGVQLLLVDPPAELEMGSGLSGLTTDAQSLALPLAASSARAIAFDDSTNPEELESRLRVIAPGGRVLAPVTLRPPNDLTELARDDRHWLAERAASGSTSRILSLERRR